MVMSDSAIAKERAIKLVKWGQGICKEHYRLIEGYRIRDSVPRFDCPQCMQLLRKKLGMKGEDDVV